MDTPDLVRILIALSPDQHDWLRRRASENKTTIAGKIRRLVALEMANRC